MGKPLMPMNKTTSRTLFSAAAAALLAFGLTGCDTFQSRAQEKSATYDQLSPGTQQRLEKGHISVGDNQDMVYIALGQPEEKRNITTSTGTSTEWIYRTYWQQYEGTAWAGWHRMIVPMAGGRGFAVYHEPITQDVYSTHIDEVIRVTFDSSGRVQNVDQNKRQ